MENEVVIIAEEALALARMKMIQGLKPGDKVNAVVRIRLIDSPDVHDLMIQGIVIQPCNRYHPDAVQILVTQQLNMHDAVYYPTGQCNWVEYDDITEVIR